MPEITGLYYAEDSVFKEASSFPVQAFKAGECFYEVLRVMNGHCLFPDDHLQRLHASVAQAGLKYTGNREEISSIIRELVRKNGLVNGNIRLVLLVKKERVPVLYSYCVPFSYPAPELYLKGVQTAVFKIVRNNPNIKHYNHKYHRKVHEFIRKTNVYEALLSDETDCITEGSKSNVFFIGSDCIFTSPGEKVLKGITREKVIMLCNRLNYKLVEMPISIDTLSLMEGVFLTGTSPKILPVNRIDQFTYSARHAILRNLMAAYDELIHEYITSG